MILKSPDFLSGKPPSSISGGARESPAEVFSMFNGEGSRLKALNLIPAIVGPFLGSFAAWSAWHGFFGKKEAKAA